MSKKDDDDRIAALLSLPEGRAQLRDSIQEGYAIAADQLEEGSPRWYIARALAGLPVRVVPQKKS